MVRYNVCRAYTSSELKKQKRRVRNSKNFDGPTKIAEQRRKTPSKM
jgi:hypothetical protein